MKIPAILLLTTTLLGGTALISAPSATAQPAPLSGISTVLPADETIPPNAIVSEGNGAAVFIGYGEDKKIFLQWRPSKKYESAKMLYQLQRSDGAMLESKTAANSYRDQGLLPNTTYTYTLTTFRSITKVVTIAKGPQKGEKTTKTIVKRVGTNTITVLTLPSQVVALQQTAETPTTATITWQPPQYMANPVTYSVYLNGNLQGYELTNYTFTITGLEAKKSYTIKVSTVNAAGEAAYNSSINVYINE